MIEFFIKHYNSDVDIYYLMYGNKNNLPWYEIIKCSGIAAASNIKMLCDLLNEKNYTVDRYGKLVEIERTDGKETLR